MSSPTLTDDADSALRAFAKEHGRRWKTRLRALWDRAVIPGGQANTERDTTCYALRNSYGPTWLTRFRFPPEPMTVIVQLKVKGKPDDVWSVVDAALDAGVVQDAINDLETDAGTVEVTSAISRPDVVHVGFVVDQVHYAAHWSCAFTSAARAREWADTTATAKSGCVLPGEAPKFVGRVESYEVES